METVPDGEPAPIGDPHFQQHIMTLPNQWEHDLLQGMMIHDACCDPLAKMIKAGDHNLFVVSDATMNGA